MYKSDVDHDNKNLQGKLKALFDLRVDKNPTMGFRPEYLDLLKGFGNPHLSLPPTIHVAGTNGKGSTIALLRSILEAAGKRVHVYTSPHLVRFNERIVLGGQAIDDCYLESLIDQALVLNNGRSVSFFEVTTAIAFKAFSDAPADVLLLEAGLGGRLDCTNVIEKPIATVITTIGLDHQEFLGDTIQSIAFEKAGIMKVGVRCISGAGEFNEITARAHALDVPLYHSDTSDVVSLARSVLLYNDFHGSFPLYQHHNLAVVLKTIDVLVDCNILSITDNHLKKGVNNFEWAGRMQRLHLDIPDGWDVYLDGGHNAAAAAALVAQVQKWRNHSSQEENTLQKDIHFVVGMMAHKDHAAFIAPIVEVADSITVVDIPDEPSAAEGQNLQNICAGSAYVSDYKAAIEVITRKAPQGCIIICGSLYLAGYVLKSEGLM